MNENKKVSVTFDDIDDISARAFVLKGLEYHASELRALLSILETRDGLTDKLEEIIESAEKTIAFIDEKRDSFADYVQEKYPAEG